MGLGNPFKEVLKLTTHRKRHIASAKHTKGLFDNQNRINTTSVTSSLFLSQTGKRDAAGIWDSLSALDAGAGGEEGDGSGGQGHGCDVVVGGGESAEEVEGGEDEDGEEEGVVVEDGEGGGLVLGDLVLLPQDALVLLLAGDLLVVGKLLAHLLEGKRRQKD